MEGAVEIQADRVEWSGGVATAEGGVEVRFGDQSLVGERATWDGELVVVERGEYRRPDGVFVFDRAEVRPRDGTGVVVAARAETGGALVVAERVEVGERWEATDATVVPCQCADGGPPALSFRAARITVVPEEVVIIHGGVARIFSIPVLPVPYWREPLDPHRFRLLIPELGWGEYGPTAKIEGRGGVGDWYLQGGPAWRADAGVRAEATLTGPGTKAEGAIGWDAEVERVRGAFASRGGVDERARVGWDVAYVSDAAYLDDYSVDYVARGVAWRDSRAVVGLFDGDATLDAWLPDDGSLGSLARLRARHTFGRGTARLTPRLGIEAIGALDGDVLGEVTPVAELGVGGAATGGLPWLALEGRADLAGRAAFGADGLVGDLPGVDDGFWEPPTSFGPPLWPDPARWGDGLAGGPLERWGVGSTGVLGTAAASAAVPVWSTLGAARIQWWPGVRAEARAGVWLDGEVDADWRAGPSVRATTGFASGGVGVDAALLHDGFGWQPAAALDVHTGTLAARVQADPAVQAGEVRWTPGVVGLGAGSAHAGELWLAWGDAALALGRFRTGGGVAWDLGGAAFSGAEARVGYDDGCASATVTARFSPDRAVPDFGFAATLRR